MEKAAANKKFKSKILKLLPKAVAFRNLPFSPRQDNRPDVNPQRFRIHQNKAFSGPIVSMIPIVARRKPRNSDTQPEPSSPKVSCMGQVKHKANKPVSSPKEFKPVSQRARPAGPKHKKTGIKKNSRKSDRAEPTGESAPALSQTRRFASSREAFANFDWTTAQIAPEEDDGGIAFSAPIVMAEGGGGDLEPKKEINLWKRRTVARPQSLQLKIG